MNIDERRKLAWERCVEALKPCSTGGVRKQRGDLWCVTGSPQGISLEESVSLRCPNGLYLPSFHSARVYQCNHKGFSFTEETTQIHNSTCNLLPAMDVIRSCRVNFWFWFIKFHVFFGRELTTRLLIPKHVFSLVTGADRTDASTFHLVPNKICCQQLCVWLGSQKYNHQGQT